MYNMDACTAVIIKKYTQVYVIQNGHYYIIDEAQTAMNC